MSRTAVDRYRQALAADDFEGATAPMHPDFVEAWPQSGEQIGGAPHWLSMINAPSHPTGDPRRPDLGQR
jgi:hypothetical protein